MKFTHVATIGEGQDGAIWKDLLFRLDFYGNCAVYDLKALSLEHTEPVAQFTLDQADKLLPHSNAVFFGTEYACAGDEFPLLYSNIYNTYAECPDPMAGICCVYRLWRDGDAFHTKLVQLRQIGFVEDRTLWRSENIADVRPYGNFILDRKQSIFYAFTMRDETASTRYFGFRLPRLHDGTPDPNYGVNRVVLNKQDILHQFDCPYHHFVQGACCRDGKIYSLEGFSDTDADRPTLRIINTHTKSQEQVVMLGDYGFVTEPELIDFYQDECFCCDYDGNLYKMEL